VALEDRFKRVDGSVWRNRLGIPSGTPVIGAVGKLAKGRGFDLLLDAASSLTVPAHVLVVGHGELLPALQRRAGHLDLEDRVHWAGYQDEALPELYSAMDIVLFTTPGSDWGHRAISEAQGCGRPVVAVSCPGVEDLIEDGVSGRIVIRNPAAMAKAVDSLIADSDVALRIGEASAVAVSDRRPVCVGECLVQFLEGVHSRVQLH